MTTETIEAVTVHVTTYRKGCPTNAAGRRHGYGLAAKDAISACHPWANQAPWLSDRTTTILITDHPSHETEAWHACGIGDSPNPSARDREVLRLLRAGRFAAAVHLALS